MGTLHVIQPLSGSRGLVLLSIELCLSIAVHGARYCTSRKERASPRSKYPLRRASSGSMGHEHGALLTTREINLSRPSTTNVDALHVFLLSSPLDQFAVACALVWSAAQRPDGPIYESRGYDCLPI
jgi:hypothetical protein